MSTSYSSSISRIEKKCIYCVNPITVESTLFRYPNDKRVLADSYFAPDSQLSMYSNFAGDLPVLYTPERSKRRLKKIKVKVKNNNGVENTIELMDRVCNICHHTLPNNFFENDYRVLSIVGAKGVGKTCFIAAMLKDMKENFHKLGINFQFVGKSVDRFYQLYNPFLSGGNAPSVTDPTEYLPPLLVQLTAKEQDEVKVVYFAIHDISGEVFNNDQLETLGKYIPNSHAIILLLDPFQEPMIRNEITQHPQLRESMEFSTTTKYTDASSVLTKLVEFIKKHKEGNKIDSHCALCFSKLDAIYPLDNDGVLFGILKKSVYNSNIDYRSADDKELRQLYTNITSVIREDHSLMESVLKKWKLDYITDSLKNHFKSYKVFAVASSVNFKAELEVQGIHVSDPILWFCEEFKLLPYQITKDENKFISVLSALIVVLMLGILWLLSGSNEGNTEEPTPSKPPLPITTPTTPITPPPPPPPPTVAKFPQGKVNIEFKELKKNKKKTKTNKKETWFISQSEIWVEDYARCVRDHKCAVPKLNTTDCNYYVYSNSLSPNTQKEYPINCLNQVEIDLFIEYIQQEMNDSTISLPTTEIWEHAATSSGKYKKLPWKNQQMDCQHARTKDCQTMPNSRLGRSDDDIINLIGNYAEVTIDQYNNKILKGGSYLNSEDNLDITFSENYDENDLVKVGLRLMKKN